MLKLLSMEMRYFSLSLIGSLLVAVAFNVLFYIFEPPPWETVFGILFMGPMVAGGVIALNRAKEKRDYLLFLLPCSRVSVFLVRFLLLFLLLLTPYVLGSLTFALKGGGGQAMEYLFLPAIYKGLLVLAIFQLQMDFAGKRLGVVTKTTAATILGVMYVAIIWALIYYESMSDLLGGVGLGFISDAILSPMQEMFNGPLALFFVSALLVFDYYLFMQDRSQ